MMDKMIAEARAAISQGQGGTSMSKFCEDQFWKYVQKGRTEADVKSKCDIAYRRAEADLAKEHQLEYIKQQEEQLLKAAWESVTTG